MTTTLTKAERSELDECEQGIMDHVEGIGMFLLRIRDKRLYRESYETFEAYTMDKFGIAKRRAYEHIEAAQVRLRLCGNPHSAKVADKITKPSHLLALSDVPEEKLPEVVETAFANDAKPTAKDFQAAKSKVMDPPKVTIVEDDEPAPVDYVLDRAKSKLEDHLRGVILQFGHLGLGGQADNEVKALRRKAGLL